MSPHRIWNGRREFKNNSLRRTAFVLAVLFLITLTVLVPLEPAFAQSADASATADSDSATSGTPAISPDQSNTDTSTVPPAATVTTPPAGTTPTAGPSPSSQNAADSSAAPTGASTDQSTAASPQSPLAPNVPPPGAPPPSGPQEGPNPQPVVTASFDQDQLKIDNNTGALHTTFPIGIPPGRNNLQPDVDLAYNSQDLQFGSIFGEGWTVSIPYIERLNKSGVDNLYSTSTLNYFTSSLDGEIVSTTTVTSTGAIYVARTDNGSFNKYAFSSSSDDWVMTDKNGTQYTFGSTADSEQSDPSNASDTFKWMLKQVTDTNNNNVIYSYFKDAGQIYPSSTVYTGNGSSTGIFEVDFLRASSTDNATSSATGFAVKSNYRVSEIDAKVNGTWVRKYVLAYTTADNGTSTLLSSITESGQNSSGTLVTLPAATFSYQTSTPGWASSSTWDPPTPFVIANGTNYDTGSVVVDVNGDALADVLVGTVESGTSTYAAWINTGSGWASSSVWIASSTPFAINGGDDGVRIADVNGDGLPDILSYDANSSSTAWINTGSGWVASSTWDPPTPFETNGLDDGVRIADVNGDGLPDILSDWLDGNGVQHPDAWINNGHGWTEDKNWDPPVAFATGNGGVDEGTRIADVNGDGLPDILNYVNGFAAGAWINTGNGWLADPTWNPPLPFAANGGLDDGVRIADLTGSGLPDFISGITNAAGSSTYDAWIDNGRGWTENTNWDPPTPIEANGGYDDGVRIADVTGSGLPDILSGYTNGSGSSTYAAWTNKTASRADLLTGITYPKGGSSAIQYKGAAQFMNSSGTIANYAPYSVPVVSQVTTNDGSGNLSSSTYQYSGGAYYYGGPFDHKFAGFGTRLADRWRGQRDEDLLRHRAAAPVHRLGSIRTISGRSEKRTASRTTTTPGDLYKVTITKWDSATSAAIAGFVFPDQTLEMDYDGPPRTTISPNRIHVTRRMATRPRRSSGAR